MNINVIRPFIRTLTCFTSHVQKRDLIYLRNKIYITNSIPILNTNNSTSWRYLCSNSSQVKALQNEEVKEVKTENASNLVEKVKIYFKNFHEEVFEVDATVGVSVLEAAQHGGLDMPGACVGQLTCTTCHVYIDEESEKILDEPSMQEEDMLDKAPFLKENSRLSCQIIVTKELEGRVFTLPKATRNFAVDGFVFEQH